MKNKSVTVSFSPYICFLFFCFLFFCFCAFRTNDNSVSFHNKVVAESGMGSGRFELPFQCSYKTLDSAEIFNHLQPLYKREEPVDKRGQGE